MEVSGAAVSDAAAADHFFWQTGDLAQILQQVNKSSVRIGARIQT
jgi:hypothetical protein